MMGPEAALVSDRIAELRRLGEDADAVPLGTDLPYVVAAVPREIEPPSHRLGLWARLGVALRERGQLGHDPGRARSIAAAPVVAADAERAGTAPEFGAGDRLLAALPVQRALDR
jgi:hypothetical protein